MRSALVLALLFALGLVTAAVAARPDTAPAADGTLAASVGPGFSISLTQNGSPVTSLAPGTYDISVSDTATVHNFHLSGPGIDMATSVAGTESTTWTVTFQAGNYHYQCDAHPTQLYGDFTVGSSAGTTSTFATTTTAQTTTASSTTVSRPSGPALAARLGKVHATRTKIWLTVTLTRPARATADLLGRSGRRLAHLSLAIRHTARLTLRPRKRLVPGLYALRLRFATNGRTVVMTKTLRVA